MEHGWYIPCESRDCSIYIETEAVAGLKQFSTLSVFRMSPLVRELILHLCVRPYPYDDAKTANIVNVLIELVKDMPAEERPMPMPRHPRLIELCTTIITNPGLSYSMKEWGRLLGMCERNLSRLFQRELGISFREWRLAIRLDYARERLLLGESVTKVAMECGYSSMSSFIERYRERFGRTPGQVCRRRQP